MSNLKCLKFKNNRIFFAILLLILLVLIIIITFIYNKHSVETFCGITIINDESELSSYSMNDLNHVDMYLDGEAAPYIEDTKTYLVPEDPNVTEWTDILASDSDSKIFILNDENMLDKHKAIQKNYRFRIYICCNGEYEERYICFTRLPVMILTQKGGGDNDIQGTGEVRLYDKKYAGYEYADSYWYQISDAEWHARGNSVYGLEKKGYKLNLLTGNGEKNDLNLLGIRDDDDWVLEALYLDGTKMKEALMEDIWELLREYESSTYKIAQGEYIEVLKNGKYNGLYYLRSRLDANLTKIDKNEDLLFKLNYYRPTTDDLWTSKEEDAEQVGCIMLEDYANNLNYAWNIIKPFSRQFVQDDVEFDLDKALNMIDLENQIDMSLMVNCFEMRDQFGNNNGFYVYDAGKKKFYRLTWDFEGALYGEKDYIVETREITKLVTAKPELRAMICERWKELKQEVFNEDNVLEILNGAESDINDSGALLRESQRWPNEPLEWKGKDLLYDNFKYRIGLLDQYYK